MRSLDRFSAGEAAVLSGATPAAQRTWRRRGLLPPLPRDRHAQFTIAEIAYLAALRALSGAGLPISRLAPAAKAAQALICEILDADASGSGALPPRFVVVEGDSIVRTGSLRAVDGLAESTVLVAIDCGALAARIRARAAGPNRRRPGRPPGARGLGLPATVPAQP